MGSGFEAPRELPVKEITTDTDSRDTESRRGTVHPEIQESEIGHIDQR